MDKPTIASILGTILGLAAGIGGMLLFSQQPAGDNTDMSVELIQPIAMEDGLRFAIREGGRTVGAGRVTKITK